MLERVGGDGEVNGETGWKYRIKIELCECNIYCQELLWNTLMKQKSSFPTVLTEIKEESLYFQKAETG